MNMCLVYIEKMKNKFLFYDKAVCGTGMCGSTSCVCVHTFIGTHHNVCHVCAQYVMYSV